MPLTGMYQVSHAFRTRPFRRAYTLLTLKVLEALRLVPKKNLSRNLDYRRGC